MEKQQLLLQLMGIRGSAPRPSEQQAARLNGRDLIDSGSDLIKLWLT